MCHALILKKLTMLINIIKAKFALGCVTKKISIFLRVGFIFIHKQLLLNHKYI